MTRVFHHDERAGIVLYHGDCSDYINAVFNHDHVITDPPYSAHVHANGRAGSEEAGGKERPLGFDSLTSELRQLVADNFMRTAKRWSLAFADVESVGVWRATMQAANVQYIRTGAWVKPNAAPQFTGDRPAAGFEAIVIGHAMNDRKPKKKKWNGGGSHGVWTFPVARGKNHPAEKPLALMMRLIELFTDPGDLILDPFAGAGTTLVAAKILGRRAIGIEVDEKWCRVAVSRLAQETLPFGTGIGEAQGA